MTTQENPGRDIFDASSSRVGEKPILGKAFVYRRLEYDMKMKRIRVEVEKAYPRFVKVDFDMKHGSSGIMADANGMFRVKVGLLCGTDDLDKGQISDHAIMRGLVSLGRELIHVEQVKMLTSESCTFKDLRILCQARMVDLFPEYWEKRYSFSRSENLAELYGHEWAMEMCSEWFPAVDPGRYNDLIVDIAHEPPDPDDGRWLFKDRHFTNYDELRSELQRYANEFDEIKATGIFPDNDTTVTWAYVAGCSAMWQHIWRDKDLLAEFTSCEKAVDQELLILREARSVFPDNDFPGGLHELDYLPWTVGFIDTYGRDKYGDASVYAFETGESGS